MIDGRSRVIVQGITGHQGRFHSQAMRSFGTRVVAGVTPGKGGEEVDGVPVYESVRDAISSHGADASVVFVPAHSAKDSALEALEAGVPLVVIVTEGMPIHDAMTVIQFSRVVGARVIGPNCPGLTVPGRAKLGIMPSSIFREGGTAVVSRSGTLTYEVVSSLTEAGIGQSICLGIGGDPVVGTSFVDALRMFEADERTSEVVLIGEIGGTAEEEAADFIRDEMSKPVVAYIAGRTAPAGRKIGHAGAIISQGKGSAKSKSKALKDAGARVAERPSEIARLL
ncbi:MAG: Succinyl-CoA ligase (ADP-forming) subunit alpha [Methanomassiliicoccales archaeon PtaB.Bin134]|jgi:succinyl-CoA synthetase alpha subunit|nr:MAG: Succinyl-CoA ligase (ADP-forming) subunit alpha [Methanomassiliicoccales archaeon PtaB.Bin134]